MLSKYNSYSPNMLSYSFKAKFNAYEFIFRNFHNYIYVYTSYTPKIIKRSLILNDLRLGKINNAK
jgi:hypothetical protein